MTVDTAVTASKRVKGPKTRRERSFHVDADTMAMLWGVCEAMDERAVLAGADLTQDPYVLSLDRIVRTRSRRATSTNRSAS